MLELVDSVAVIRMDRPPVNALDHSLRGRTLAGLHAAEEDPRVAAIVLTGSPTRFSAGADVREFGTPAQRREPVLRTLVAAIEFCGKPVVAAIEGYALGGGLEIAMACHERVAAENASLGLPEIHLGLIPGSGGTQRLPRLVGADTALDIMMDGAARKAFELADTQLVKVVGSARVQAEAIAMARQLAETGNWTRTSSIAVEPERLQECIESRRGRLTRRQRLQPAYGALLDAVGAAALPIDAGLARERELFLRLCESPESIAIRAISAAERTTSRGPESSLSDVRRIAVIGCGTMGASIAVCAIQAGLEVVVVERDPDSIEAGVKRVQALGAEHESSTAALRFTSDWSELAACDAVVEAVFEEIGLKQAVFERLDRHAQPGALLATNTSYLDVGAIAGATSRQGDVVGLHFFSPAHAMRLLEVVRAESTSTRTLSRAMALARRLGKIPVQARNAFGFIGNRIFSAYRRQCEFMLEDGAWPEEIDDAVTAFGFAMGPFAVADLSGLDVAWRVRQAMSPSRDPRERYVAVADRLCEMGRFDRKTGAGYYTYTQGQRSRATDATVKGIIAQCRVGRTVMDSLGPHEIQKRALLAMVNEAAWVLHESVAERASDIDVVLVNGYGFPRWKGGPVHWARLQKRDALLDGLAQIGRSDPANIRVASASMVDKLLEIRAP